MKSAPRWAYSPAPAGEAQPPAAAAQQTAATRAHRRPSTAHEESGSHQGRTITPGLESGQPSRRWPSPGQRHQTRGRDPHQWRTMPVHRISGTCPIGRSAQADLSHDPVIVQDPSPQATPSPMLDARSSRAGAVDATHLVREQADTRPVSPSRLRIGLPRKSCLSSALAGSKTCFASAAGSLAARRLLSPFSVDLAVRVCSAAGLQWPRFTRGECGVERAESCRAGGDVRQAPAARTEPTAPARL